MTKRFCDLCDVEIADTERWFDVVLHVHRDATGGDPVDTHDLEACYNCVRSGLAVRVLLARHDPSVVVRPALVTPREPRPPAPRCAECGDVLRPTDGEALRVDPAQPLYCDTCDREVAPARALEPAAAAPLDDQQRRFHDDARGRQA